MRAFWAAAVLALTLAGTAAAANDRREGQTVRPGWNLFSDERDGGRGKARPHQGAGRNDERTQSADARRDQGAVNRTGGKDARGH